MPIPTSVTAVGACDGAPAILYSSGMHEKTSSNGRREHSKIVRPLGTGSNIKRLKHLISPVFARKDVVISQFEIEDVVHGIEISQPLKHLQTTIQRYNAPNNLAFCHSEGEDPG